MGIGAALEAPPVSFEALASVRFSLIDNVRGIWHSGIRCMQRLDFLFDQPLEVAPPLGKLRLAEDFEAALPGEQVACNGA